VNPILAPRQRFILPIEATDLGLKWDWGLDLKGPAGEYDWEIALTIGSGETLRKPHLFEGSDRTSYLITGRIGHPTYWNFQQGLSFLFGNLRPSMRAPPMLFTMSMQQMFWDPRALSDIPISRWRIAYDVFYKHGTYLMTGGQLSYGQGGFARDEKFVSLTLGGQTGDVLATAHGPTG